MSSLTVSADLTLLWKFMATLAPRSASSLAIAKPMPREAPVTKATLPSSCRGEEILSSGNTAVAIPILLFLVQRFEDRSDTLTAADAHGYEEIGRAHV